MRRLMDLDEMKKNIFINASAAKHGGALSIVRHFLYYLENNDSNNLYYIHCPALKEQKLPSNVFLVDAPFFRKSWIYRIYWDVVGYRRWIKKNKLKVDLYISFQNSGFWNSQPTLIYYHQPIPLSPYKWSFLKPEERVLWFYKNIYLILVRWSFNNNTEFVVQSQWIKEKLSSTLRIEANNIHVIRPSLPLIHTEIVDNFPFDNSKINLFFPAALLVYKNHLVLVKALEHIRKIGGDYQKYLMHFTIQCSDSSNIVKLINKLELKESFVFHGNISFEQVCTMYKSCDVVVFPSYMETFGLPLIESAQFGKQMIVADCDYSRENLKGYPSVDYIDPFDFQKWASAIMKINHNKLVVFKGKSYYPDEPSDWSSFFRLVQRKIE